VPDSDIGEYICDIFAVVRSHFKMLVDVLEFDDCNSVCGLEELGHRMRKHIIGEVFEPVHFNAAFFDIPGIFD
jgi:hypothetical protein